MSQQQCPSYLQQEGESHDAYSDRFYRGTVNRTWSMWVLIDMQGQQHRSGQRMFLHTLQTAQDL
jgi:hypothetical protein